MNSSCQQWWDNNISYYPPSETLPIHLSFLHCCQNGSLPTLENIIATHCNDDNEMCHRYLTTAIPKNIPSHPLWSNRLRDIKREESPLHAAFSNGHFDIVSFLVRRDPRLLYATTTTTTINDGDTAKNNNAAYPPSSSSSPPSETILHRACRHGITTLVETALAILPPPRCDDDDDGNLSVLDQFRDSQGRTCAHLAASYGHTTCLELLLRTGRVNANVRCGSSSSSEDDEEMPSSLSSSSMAGTTPFLCAVKRGRASCAKLLFYWRGDGGGTTVDPHACDRFGANALHYAVLQSVSRRRRGGGCGESDDDDEVVDVNFVRWLLEECSLDVNRVDRWNRTPLYIALTSACGGTGGGGRKKLHRDEIASAAEVVTLLARYGADATISYAGAISPEDIVASAGNDAQVGDVNEAVAALAALVHDMVTEREEQKVEMIRRAWRKRGCCRRDGEMTKGMGMGRSFLTSEEMEEFERYRDRYGAPLEIGGLL